MPLTRTANSALDKVAPQKAEVAEMLAAYGETDLICYRAEGPETLARRQSEIWDPLLAWAAETLSAPLVATVGVIPVPQPEASVARLRDQVHALDPFALAAFHDLVAISGSLVIALAALKRQGTPESLWDASRIDETWQEELWGHDEEAAEMALNKRADFLQAMRFLGLVEPNL
jgi:chaperone required for assembly of F1-ATPase